MIMHFLQKIPIFLGGFPLFATLPPFRNTFSESLGVAKRGTTGVIHTGSPLMTFVFDIHYNESFYSI